MKKVIIFDIDGTLADLNGREQFLHNGKKDWKNFNANMDKDLPNTPVVELYRTLYESNRYELILVSGRQECFRKVTETWLVWHQIPFDTLLMRRDDDFRHDHEVKQGILQSLQAQGKEILLSVDDRQSVVDMWRANGITCLQCTKGDY
jgi:FMN phosphatase YigB (HAD superfamily)